MLSRIITLFCLLFSFSAAYVPNTNHWVRRSPSFLKSTKEEKAQTHDAVSTSLSSLAGQRDLEYAIGEALWKMKVFQEDPRFLPTRPTAPQNLFQTCKKSAQIAPSSIPAAGNGLFAGHDIIIPAGSIFSFYPVPALGVNFRDGCTYLHAKDNHDYVNSAYVMALMGNRPILGLDLQTIGNDNDWKNKTNDSGCLGFVDADPSRRIEPAWQCHMINDGACIETNTKDDVIKYYAASLNAQNAVFVPFGPSPIVVAVATKDILQGDEIFTCYGRAYWLGMVEPNKDLWSLRSDDDEIILIEKKIGNVLNQVSNHIESVYAQEEMELCEAFETIA